MAKNGNVHPNRIFQKPEELKEAWDQYKNSLKEQGKQWGVKQFVGKDGKEETVYPNLPITMSGFYAWYYNTTGHYIEQYFVNTDNMYDDFLGICRVCKNEARANQITGGLIGQYNPSITQRLNNLKEQTDNTTQHNVNLLTNDPLSDEST